MSNKVPQIRFNGYSDAWEERKFKNFISKSGRRNKTGELTEAYSVSNTLGLVKQSDQFNGSRLDSLDKKDYKIVQPNEFAYNPARINVGSIAFNNLGKPVIVSSLYVIVNMSDTLNNQFILHWLKSPAFNYEVIRNTEGSVREYLFYENFSNVSFPYTPNYDEQIKIGQFFNQLDNTIALHQRKLDLLKEQKKGYLQKMFPKNGAKVPELRFAGFADDWVERKFGELYKKVNEKNDLSFGKDRVISVANMYFKDTDNIRSDDAYMKTYNIFRTGDIAFEGNRSKHFSYGRFVENTIGDGIVSHVFDVFRPIQQFDLNYWKYAIHNESVMGPILMTATTSSTMMTNLVAKDFLKRAILVPSYPEQKLVGSFFKQLDDTIALHQHKLALLKEQKKGYLQKMFV
ncbi:restriction endonuclease subunit S [Weissella cibaria]|uniref:Type I restriction modification DNA specificity domain protein n=1 Tax=Weissella cibaria TaxID=137591 RepID=A0A0D1M4H4_9LACO|nr:restriction endonuclease subunit S [Weissella cibaria]KIU25732.1 Type I restriction modification DNA specificity domain protein [Weissella cibaria]